VSEKTSQRLSSAINILQVTILDVHHLFFKTVSIPAGDQNMGAGSGPGVGLLSYYRRRFAMDCLKEFEPLLCPSPSDASTASTTVQSTDVRKSCSFDLSAFDMDDRRRCSPSRVRALFDEWLARVVQRMSQRCRVALGAMQSALEVARMQQRVWLSCCSVDSEWSSTNATVVPPELIRGTSGSSTNNSSGGNGNSSNKSSANSGESGVDVHGLTGEGVYSQADWEAACAELLAPRKRHTPSASASAVA